MKRVVGLFAFIVFTVTIAAMAVGAESSNNKQHSAEHKAAIKKCYDDYKAALNAARRQQGKERRLAEAMAKADRKQCYANAPR